MLVGIYEAATSGGDVLHHWLTTDIEPTRICTGSIHLSFHNKHDSPSFSLSPFGGQIGNRTVPILLKSINYYRNLLKENQAQK